MKILLLNTSLRKGGAAIACHRLWKALNKHGIKSELLVRKGFAGKIAFLTERLHIFIINRLTWKNLFSVSTAKAGVNIKKTAQFKGSDIIHIHWVQQGFISLKQIAAIQKTGVPIVWTLHDMWPFTGICHYSGKCNRYTENCGNCLFLNNPSEHDLSYKIMCRKKKHIDFSKIVFVACSEWMAGKARESMLLNKSRIITIPNPIDTDVFAPGDKIEARRKLGLNVSGKIILFGAAKVSDKRKGIGYFLEACHILYSTHSIDPDNITVVFFGKGDSSGLSELIPFRSVHLKYLSDETDLATMYNAADVFVIPSMEDNLPNTIVESFACGTPVAGFASGGITSMIENGINGDLAEPGNPNELALSIFKILFSYDSAIMRDGARNTALERYSEEVVAKQYNTLYQSLICSN